MLLLCHATHHRVVQRSGQPNAQGLRRRWPKIELCTVDNPFSLAHYDERPPQGGDCYVQFDKGWGLKLADRQRVFEVAG